MVQKQSISQEEINLYYFLRKKGLSPSDADDAIKYRKKHNFGFKMFPL